MSNSQNAENEQQNNLCTTLTEQWKKGELELGGCYFIKLKSGKIVPQMYSFVCIDGKHHCTDFGLSYGNVEEVLAPVPSYEEWKAAYECQLMESELVLTLKDLLLKIRNRQSLIREYLSDCKLGNAWDLLYQTENEIDNAIGEKK